MNELGVDIMSRCPFKFNECRDDCEIYNRNLKGCHISSLTLSINKIAHILNESKKVKSEKKKMSIDDFNRMYEGKSKDEIKDELFRKLEDKK